MWTRSSRGRDRSDEGGFDPECLFEGDRGAEGIRMGREGVIVVAVGAFKENGTGLGQGKTIRRREQSQAYMPDTSSQRQSVLMLTRK